MIRPDRSGRPACALLHPGKDFALKCLFCDQGEHHFVFTAHGTCVINRLNDTIRHELGQPRNDKQCQKSSKWISIGNRASQEQHQTRNLTNRQQKTQYMCKCRELALCHITAKIFKCFRVKLFFFRLHPTSGCLKLYGKFRFPRKLFDCSMSLLPLRFLDIPRCEMVCKCLFSLLCMTDRNHLIQRILSKQINICGNTIVLAQIHSSFLFKLPPSIGKTIAIPPADLPFFCKHLLSFRYNTVPFHKCYKADQEQHTGDHQKRRI